MRTSERIAVIGLGYVGLPLALAFAREHGDVIGFDIDDKRVAALSEGRDWTNETTEEALRQSPVRFTSRPDDLIGASFFAITVPTPVDETKRPDLSAIEKACEIVGPALVPDAVVVVESTVYPGVTETICGPILAARSGMESGKDFKLGYSPERMNPGDTEHGLEQIVKVIAAQDEETLERVANVYRPITKAGLHLAPSIRVAETAKIIENVQRDLNIALMNEVAIICDKLDIATRDVLAAAVTKWNFLPFHPGLVGGHCVSVDPFYLTMRAEMAGYHPEVILAGRRINDAMGAFIGRKTAALLLQNGNDPNKTRVGVMGITFKEDVRDIRNSRVPDIVRELERFGFGASVLDPLADPKEVAEEFGITLVDTLTYEDLDALVLAVPHRQYLEKLHDGIISRLRSKAVLIDVKSVIDRSRLPDGLSYWSL